MLPEGGFRGRWRAARLLPLDRGPNPIAPGRRPIEFGRVLPGRRCPIIAELCRLVIGRLQGKAHRHGRIKIRLEIGRDPASFFGNRRFLFYISGFWLLDWHCVRIADGLRMHRIFVVFLVFSPPLRRCRFCEFRIFFTPAEFFSNAPVPQTALDNDQFSIVFEGFNDCREASFADAAEPRELVQIAKRDRVRALIHQRQERNINAGLIRLQPARSRQPVRCEEPEIWCLILNRHDEKPREVRAGAKAAPALFICEPECVPIGSRGRVNLNRRRRSARAMPEFAGRFPPAQFAE